MSFTGVVEHGVVQLPDGVALPEGTEVFIKPTLEQSGRKTLAERYSAIIGVVDDMPSDLAEQVDHYVHGLPKRERGLR